MKIMHAQWLTVQKTDIDHDTSIEILWQTAPNTLHALILCIGRDGNKASLTSEEIGPFHCLADLRQRLCMLFGEHAAQRICNPSCWLPPGIPVIRSEPLRPATRSHLAMTDVQQSEKIQPVLSHKHWTEVA